MDCYFLKISSSSFQVIVVLVLFLSPTEKERNQVHGSLLMLSTKCEDAIRGDEHGEKNVPGWLLLASQNSNNLVIPHLVGRSPVPEVPYKYSVTDSP